MPNAYSLFLFALFLLPRSQGAPPIPAAELQKARALVQRVAKALEGTEEMHGDFVQEQHTLLLDEPLISEGRLHLRSKPGCLVLDLEKPKRVLVRSDERSHQVYYPAEKKAERYLFESNELAKSLLALLSSDITKIESGFDITGFEANETLEVIELRPSDVEKRKLVDKLRLSVSKTKSSLREVSFVNADGERTVLRLSKLEMIKADSPPQEREREGHVFDAPLPKDVRLVVHNVPKAAEK